jgi:preprotein translocase subunit YajC
VIVFDLFSFGVAFVALMFFVRIPEMNRENEAKETIIKSAKAGLIYLKENRGILDLILFLAAINLIASIYNAALPAMILSRQGGKEVALGLVTMVEGIATMAGSLMVSLLPAPKSRVRIICNSLLFAMSTENFFLALGRSVPLWCIGAVLGWIVIPVMGANMDVLFRNHIPIEMQGRVYSARNTLQFFTIPIGYLMGGILVDKVFEPLMKAQRPDSILTILFGSGKGSGAAFLFLIIAFMGIFVCLIFRKDRHIWQLEK